MRSAAVRVHAAVSGLWISFVIADLGGPVCVFLPSKRWDNCRMVRRQRTTGGRPILAVLMSLVAAAISGTIFVVALFREFPLVEVAASLLTGLQVFFLSSAIADLMEKKRESNRARSSAVVLATIFLIAFYSFTRYLRWGRSERTSLPESVKCCSSACSAY